jgi:protein-S-isoprenylcysteine O-methyltransferase Ste14
MEDNKRYNENQIFIVSFNGENSMLMEAETKEDAMAWIVSIRTHIKYANENQFSNSTTNGAANSTRSTAAETEVSIKEDIAAAVIDATAASTSVSPHSEKEMVQAPKVPTNFRRGSSLSIRGIVVPSNNNSVSGSSSSSTDNREASAATNTSSSSDSTQQQQQQQSSVAVVHKDTVDFAAFCSGLPSYCADVATKLSSFDSRDKLFSDVSASSRATIISAFESINDGEVGSRGEKWSSLILMLVSSILIGLHAFFERLVGFLIRTSSALYILVGILMILNGLLELKSNMSLFFAPVERSKLVTSGVFRLVRHPIYGGLLLLCFGVSIASQRFDKLVLTIALAAVLDKVADIEETALLQEHPVVSTPCDMM